MVDQRSERREADALRDGRAWVDVSDRRTISVVGTDAIGWLHDLLTADIAALAPGRARRSLLLTPTGHIRADVHVVRRDDDVVLIQDTDQPEDIRSALDPYVLSSDVRLEDVSGRLALFALPGLDAAPGDVPAFSVSCLGSGVDVIVDASTASSVRADLEAAGLREAGRAAAESWRIERGVPRMGADFDARSLPSEARLDDVIDDTKGCFLGQESVARVRNLGHPPRVLRHMRGDAGLVAGMRVNDGGTDVGEVTSATWRDDGGSAIALVRVAWAAATARLTDTDGHPLHEADAPG
jgi:tRNA-modifying protein YgfZ